MRILPGRGKWPTFLALTWLVAWVGVGLSHDLWHLVHFEGKNNNTCVVCRALDLSLDVEPDAGIQIPSPRFYLIRCEIGTDPEPHISRELSASCAPRAPPPSF